MVHSAANALYNSIQDPKHCPRLVRAHPLGGYREVRVSFAAVHKDIPPAANPADEQGEGECRSQRSRSSCSSESSPDGHRKCSPASLAAYRASLTIGEQSARRFVEDPAAVVGLELRRALGEEDSLYIRPAIRRAIQPFKPKKSEGIRGAIAAYVKKTYSPQEKWESLADVQGRNGLLDSVSVISGTDTVLGSFKSPELSGKHGAADQTRHGLPACDWSLHGVDSERAEHQKSLPELEKELMTVFEDALRHGTVRLADHDCPCYCDDTSLPTHQSHPRHEADDTSLSTQQSYPRHEAGQKALGFREILYMKVGLQRLIAAGSPERSEPVCPPPPVLATGVASV